MNTNLKIQYFSKSSPGASTVVYDKLYRIDDEDSGDDATIGSDADENDADGDEDDGGDDDAI